MLKKGAKKGGKKKDEVGEAADGMENLSVDTSPEKNRTLDAGGTLLVRVVKAQGLPGEDCGENLRVYCMIEFDQNEIMVETQNNDPINPVWKHRAHFDVARMDTELTISVWAKDLDSGKEKFLGMQKMKPPMEDGALYDNWVGLSGTMDTDDAGPKSGEMHLQLSYKKPEKNKKMKMEDFDLLKVIGQGSFGKVMQVRKKDTGRIYAMKIIRKANIVERDEVEHTIAERNVLAKINHPYIVNLKFAFQTQDKLYLVLAFVNGGELFKHLQDEGQFEEARAKFYTAQLLLALEHLHTYNIIYRDLKPENILLDYSGNIALCDFGLCKLQMRKDTKTFSFCGTPEYLAPELLLGDGYTKVVDWWTLGVLLYEMLTGLPPFYDEEVDEMYKKILHQELTFPPEVSPTARMLLMRLLERDPEKRLGSNGASEIRNHEFFSDINWHKLMARKVKPLFKPQVKSATDTTNFDEEFTAQVPVDSLVEESDLTASMQDRFAGFTYTAENKMTYAATPQMGSSIRQHPKGF